MPPKSVATSDWNGISVVRGALAKCADPCAFELMMRLNIDTNDAMIHTPLMHHQFFIRQPDVSEFKRRADELLNPLGRKRPRAQRVDGNVFEEDADEY